MVRRDLKLVVGVGVFALLVGALAFIALNREPGPSPLGRWDLILVETPDGTIEAGTGEGWIEIDDGTFRGEMECVDFEGTYRMGGVSGFMPDSWSHTWLCDSLVGSGEAFDLYFGNIGTYRVDGNLSLESPDGSVRFVFVREGQA